MPYSYLVDLFIKVKELFNNLNLNDENENQLFQSFEEMQSSFINSVVHFHEMLNGFGDQLITDEQATELSNSFAEVSENFRALKDVVETLGVFCVDESIMDKVVNNPIELDNICIVTDYFAKEFKQYSSQAGENKRNPETLNTISQHIGWVDQLLHEDAEFTEWQEKMVHPTNPSVGKKLENYHDIKKYLPEKLKQHLQTATNCKNAEECLAVKRAMVEMVLGEEDVTKHPVVMMAEANRQLNVKTLVKDMEDDTLTDAKINTAKEIGTALGVQPELFQEMKDSTLLANIDRHVTRGLLKLDDTVDTDFDIISLRHPYRSLMVQTALLKKRVFGFLLNVREEDGEDIEAEENAENRAYNLQDVLDDAENRRVSTENYGRILDEIIAVVNNEEPFTQDGNRNDGPFELALAAKQIAEAYPELMARYETGVRPFEQKIMAQMEQNYIAYAPVETYKLEDAKKYMNNVQRMQREPFVSEDEYSRFYFLCLVKNHEFRQDQQNVIQAALAEYDRTGKITPIAGDYSYLRINYDKIDKTNPEEVTRFFLKNLTRAQMYLSYLEEELPKTFHRNRNLKADTYAEKLQHERNIALDAIGINGMIRADGALGIDASRQALNQGEEFNALINDTPEKMVAFLKGDKTSVIYGKSTELFSLENTESINALTQNSGNFYLHNSTEYNNIGEALANLHQSEYRGGGPTAKDYERLYNSFITYLRTHKSVPTSTNGKLRVNAVLELLPDVAMKLVEMAPSKTDRVVRDLEIEMVRHANFKESCARKMQEMINSKREIANGLNGRKYAKLTEGEKGLVDMAYATIQFEKEITKAVDGTCETAELENRVIEPYQYTIEKINESKQLYKDMNLVHAVKVQDGSFVMNKAALEQPIEEARTALSQYFIKNRQVFQDEKLFKKDEKAICEKLAAIIVHQRFENKLAGVKTMPNDSKKFTDILAQKDRMELEARVIANSTIMEKIVNRLGAEGISKLAVDTKDGLAARFTELYDTMEMGLLKEDVQARADEMLTAFNSLSVNNPFIVMAQNDVRVKRMLTKCGLPMVEDSMMDKQGWIGWLDTQIAQKQEEVKSAVSDKKDDQVVDALAKVVYLTYIKDKNNGPEGSTKNIMKELENNFSKTVEELKPCIGVIINGMSDANYKAFAKDGNLAKEVAKEIRENYAEPAERIQANTEYDRLMKANHGVFARTAKAPMFGM